MTSVTLFGYFPNETHPRCARPRNTDNAWAETEVSIYHCSEELAEKLDFIGTVRVNTTESDKSNTFKWIDVDVSNPLYNNLYGNHREFIELATPRLRYRGNVRTVSDASIVCDKVAFVTDIEGNWSYFLRWVENCEGLKLLGYRTDGSADLALLPGWKLVFGGDVCDKGPSKGVGGSVRVANSLLALKRQHPERVKLILGEHVHLIGRWARRRCSSCIPSRSHIQSAPEPARKRVLKLVLELKHVLPVRASGNRDINKLRFASELAPTRDNALDGSRDFDKLQAVRAPHYWVPEAKRITPVAYLRKLVATERGKDEADVTPDEILDANTSANRLRYILKETMGADGEFERRQNELRAIKRQRMQSELGDVSVSEEETVSSFVQSVKPGGFMLELIEHGHLASRIGSTLFVHGGLVFKSDAKDSKEEVVLGVVPGRPLVKEVDEWTRLLNEWKTKQLKEWKDKAWQAAMDRSDVAVNAQGGTDLIDYVVGTSRHPSVVMARHLDSNSMPKPLPDEVVKELATAKIKRVVIGHTPHGNAPTIIPCRSADNFVHLIMCDTSYSDSSKDDMRGEAVSTVVIEDQSTTVEGKLQDGREIEYKVSVGEADHSNKDGEHLYDRHIGQRVVKAGEEWFVKAKLHSGQYVLCQHAGFKVNYQDIEEAALQKLRHSPS